MIYSYNFQWNNPEIIISILAFIVSVIGLFLTVKALQIQRKHNQLSLIPYGQIILGDYEDEIFVKLVNAGVGPLIINRLSASNIAMSSNNLIDLLDFKLPRGLEWADFVVELENRVLKINEELILIKIAGLDEATVKGDLVTNQKFVRDLRRRLSEITLKFEYRDVYNNNFMESRQLSWFGRHEEKQGLKKNNNNR